MDWIDRRHAASSDPASVVAHNTVSTSGPTWASTRAGCGPSAGSAPDSATTRPPVDADAADASSSC
eukprot:4618356-Pyramimonas_sp.AAC.1